MAKPRVSLLDDFERVMDEFFDEMLIGRWRGAEQAEPAEVVDHGDRYEVRIAAPEIDPAHLDVEVHDRRLTIRIPTRQGGKLESAFRFSDAIESAQVSAHWAAGILTIILPKQKGRRVALKNS
jgi:HSP20 family molecular chaperone IbpA